MLTRLILATVHNFVRIRWRVGIEALFLNIKIESVKRSIRLLDFFRIIVLYIAMKSFNDFIIVGVRTTMGLLKLYSQQHFAFRVFILCEKFFFYVQRTRCEQWIKMGMEKCYENINFSQSSPQRFCCVSSFFSYSECAIFRIFYLKFA